MNEDLLQDLVLYKKSHEKAVSTAARSLITLFREICPSLLVKKDRGRPIDPKARPKAFGEVSVASDVPGLELLQEDDSMSDGSDDEVDACAEENEGEDKENASVENDEEDAVLEEGEEGEEEDVEEDESDDDHDIDNDDDDDAIDGDDVDLDGDDVDGDLDDEDVDDDDDGDDDNTNNDDDTDEEREKSKAQKRKFLDYVGQLNAADTSLRALKKLAGTKMEVVPSDIADGILSNEDFQRIKELKAKKEAKLALAQQGLVKKGDPKASAFKIPSSEQLSSKRVDPAILEVNIRRKHSKEERLALIRAGRDDRGEYRSRAFVKQKKTGGLSNRQKEHKKLMPMAAKRQKVARSRQEKKKRDRRSSKQFRGKKAWK